MLVLFDIDGTLITTKRSGLHAMQDAIFDICGIRPEVDSISFAGRLDPLILDDILVASGIESSPAVVNEIRRAYRGRLSERLAAAEVGRVLPGVHELVRALAAFDDCSMGLVTGNFEETGRLKLESCGVDLTGMDYNAFGDECPVDPPHRRQLPRLAMDRYEERRSRKIDPERVIVIGDTPADVDCAAHNGCRSLAVATGVHGTGELASAGASLCVEDLGATADILAWLRSA